MTNKNVLHDAGDGLDEVNPKKPDGVQRHFELVNRLLDNNPEPVNHLIERNPEPVNHLIERNPELVNHLITNKNPAPEIAGVSAERAMDVLNRGTDSTLKGILGTDDVSEVVRGLKNVRMLSEHRDGTMSIGETQDGKFLVTYYAPVSRFGSGRQKRIRRGEPSSVVKIVDKRSGEVVFGRRE